MTVAIATYLGLAALAAATYLGLAALVGFAAYAIVGKD